MQVDRGSGAYPRELRAMVGYTLDGVPTYYRARAHTHTSSNLETPISQWKETRVPRENPSGIERSHPHTHTVRFKAQTLEATGNILYYHYWVNARARVFFLPSLSLPIPAKYDIINNQATDKKSHPKMFLCKIHESGLAWTDWM